MGKRQLQLLKFAIRYSGSWHSYGVERPTVDAVRSLEAKGLIIVNRKFRQFTLATKAALDEQAKHEANLEAVK